MGLCLIGLKGEEMNHEKEIRYIEMFAGIGGFRYGLERANNICGEYRNTEKGNRRTGTSFESSQATSKSLRSEGDSSNSVKPRDSGQIQCNSGGFLQGEKEKNLRNRSSITKWKTGTKSCRIGTNPQSGVRNSKGQNESLFEGSRRRDFKKFHCVWSNEIDKYACQIYRKNFGDKELVEADIKTIDPNTIPDFELLTAGFPCQAFSVAGKRKGFQDTRGTLFYDIIRVAEAKRPRLLLLENVKGLLSHDEGLTFQIIIESLEELGYLVEWQVLNSKHFGVPQNRERVFIIGHLGGKSGCQIFPIGETGKESVGSRRKTQGNGSRVRIANPLGVGGSFKERNLIKVGNVDKKGHNSLWGRVYSPEGIAPNLNAKGGGLGAKTGLIAQALQTDGFLRSGCSWGTTKPQSARNIRRLTPRECERLQGFPDGWTEGISDTQRYKCLGNAVTTNVVTFLGKLLLSNYQVAVNGY